MHCERHEFTGLSVDGGFADYVRVSERSLLKLPPEPSLRFSPRTRTPESRRTTPSAGSLTSGARLDRGRHRRGRCRHIGLQLLRELGSSFVVAVDGDERRRKLAEGLGADAVVDAGEPAKSAVGDLTGGAGAELVLDFVGSDQTHADGMAMLARGGTYSIVGYGGTVSIPSVELIATEKAVVGNLVGGWPDLWEVLQLHARGRLQLRVETHPLTEINAVLDGLRAGEITGRAVLVP